MPLLLGNEKIKSVAHLKLLNRTKKVLLVVCPVAMDRNEQFTHQMLFTSVVIFIMVHLHDTIKNGL